MQVFRNESHKCWNTLIDCLSVDGSIQKCVQCFRLFIFGHKIFPSAFHFHEVDDLFRKYKECSMFHLVNKVIWITAWNRYIVFNSNGYDTQWQWLETKAMGYGRKRRKKMILRSISCSSSISIFVYPIRILNNQVFAYTINIQRIFQWNSWFSWAFDLVVCVLLRFIRH